MDFFIEWMKLHPEYSALAVIIITFVESFAFLGALVPGVIVLFAASTIIANTGSMGLLPLIMITALASATSNIISFYLGYGFRHRMTGWRLYQRYQHLFRKGEEFIDQWGAYSVVIGRFVGPVRPFVAFIAGSLAMPPGRFILLDLLTVCIWAPVYILPGYMTGLAADYLIEDWHQWPPAVTLSAVAAAGIAIFCAGNFLIHRQNHRWDGLTRKWKIDEFPAASLIWMLVSLALLFVVILERPLPEDLLFSHGMLNAAADSPLNLIKMVTHAGDMEIMVLNSCIWVLALLLMRYRPAALISLSALLLTAAAVYLMKHYFQVERPSPKLIEQGGFSFPSGHATSAAAFFGMQAAFLNESVRRHIRWIIYATAALATMAIAYSRVWLNVHWFSDITAGILLGSAVVCLLRIAYTFCRQPPLPLNRFILSVLLLQGITTISYILAQ